MSKELPIRITSVFTLAEGQQERLKQNEIHEYLSSKTKQNQASSWPHYNEQLSTMCSVEKSESGKRSIDPCISSSEEKQVLEDIRSSENLQSPAISATEKDAKSLTLNTASKQDIKAGDNLPGNITQDRIYTVFRISKDSCPSFCCRYNPALLSTLRAKAKRLNWAEVKTTTSYSAQSSRERQAIDQRSEIS